MSVYTIFFTIGFWIFCIVCVFWMNDIVAWHGRACNDVQCVCVFPTMCWCWGCALLSYSLCSIC